MNSPSKPPGPALILDFDGVVLESVNIKDQAFYDLFDQISDEQRRAVMAYHLERPGLPRKPKIAGMLSDLISHGADPDPALVDALAKRFSDLVIHKILQAPLVAGIERAVQRAEGQCWVVTAGPEDETKMICEKRQILPWFQAVYGSPTRKSENLSKLCKTQGLDPRRALFIGDNFSDFEAAKANGIHFLGRLIEGKTDPFPPDIPTIRDFDRDFDLFENMLMGI